MSEPVLDPRIVAFYRERYREDLRLQRTAHGQLEMARTRELLERFLPAPPATVLDIGGGPGVHARWLAEAGYSVTLVDPVVEHVTQAAGIPGVTALVGDARALDHRDDSYDVALLLGPLYHLVEPVDRARALSEATRVIRPGGLLAAAAISRYSGVLEYAANGRLAGAADDVIREALATGVHRDDPRGFTTAYFHLPAELAAELDRAGLIDVLVYGVEGPSAPALDNVPLDRLPDLMPSALLAARLLETDPAILATSPHLLAVGRVPMRPGRLGPDA